MPTRVYLPVSSADLTTLAADGRLPAGPGGTRRAHAVTSALTQAHPSVDEEDLEYLAFCDAARSAVPDHPPRLVLAGDVEAAEVLADTGGAGQKHPRSAVEVRGQVAVRQVVSVHVEDLVGPPSGPGELPDFLWYDVTELDSVVDQLPN